MRAMRVSMAFVLFNGKQQLMWTVLWSFLLVRDRARRGLSHGALPI
jgi:hypothetical protein